MGRHSENNTYQNRPAVRPSRWVTMGYLPGLQRYGSHGPAIEIDGLPFLKMVILPIKKWCCLFNSYVNYIPFIVMWTGTDGTELTE